MDIDIETMNKELQYLISFDKSELSEQELIIIMESVIRFKRIQKQYPNCKKSSE